MYELTGLSPFLARRPHLDLHLQGAPNFRKADVPVEVYGCAQPTVTGLKGVLSVLQCRPIRQPRTSKGRERVNSGRPGASPRLAPGSLPDGNEGAKTPVLGSSPPKSWESHSLDEAMASFGSSPPAESGFAGARRPSGTPLGAAFDSMAPPRKCVWFCTREVSTEVYREIIAHSLTASLPTSPTGAGG